MPSSLALTLAQLETDPDFVDLRTLPDIRIDLKYATEDNFMQKNVYSAFCEPFLHRLTAEKLRDASQQVQQAHPNYRILVYDALRPRSIQRVLWNYVKDTPHEIYVANPDRGSMHNYGCAVDLTIADDKGVPLDMGTAFDEFHPRSQPKLEAEYLRSGELTSAQLENRLVLRRAMTGAGFIQNPHEWWHYDAFAQNEVRARFRIIE